MGARAVGRDHNAARALFLDNTTEIAIWCSCIHVQASVKRDLHVFYKTDILRAALQQRGASVPEIDLLLAQLEKCSSSPEAFKNGIPNLIRREFKFSR